MRKFGYDASVCPSAHTDCEGLEVERLSKGTEGSPRHVPYLCLIFDVKLTSLRATKGVARVIIYIAVSCVLLKIIGNRLLRLCVLLCHAFCHVPRIMFSGIV